MVFYSTCHTCRGPAEGTKYCSDACKPRCSVLGCTSPSRKRGWCAAHYSQARTTGQAPKPFTYKWAERGAACKVCGKPSDGYGLREVCSKACFFLHQKYPGGRPTSADCVACGAAIDLLERGKKGQLRKTSVKFCRRCLQDRHKHGLSVGELAERDGTDCGLCCQPVDMTLTRADGLMCASVDHIVPRSKGGGDDPANLQLAHLRCNMAKSDRVAVASVEGDS